MSATQQERQVIDLVEALQAERDELLELLGHVVAASVTTTPNGNAAAVIPAAVIAEIRRRVGAEPRPPRRNAFDA